MKEHLKIVNSVSKIIYLECKEASKAIKCENIVKIRHHQLHLILPSFDFGNTLKTIRKYACLNKHLLF